MRCFMIYVFFVSLTSCSEYKFVAKKENVMYDEKGYMCITGKRAFFVESKDSLLNLGQIFNNITQKTFWLPLLPKDDYYALKLSGKSSVVQNLYNQKTGEGVLDSVYYIYIRLRAYPEMNSNKTIDFKTSSQDNCSYFKISNRVYCIKNQTFDQNIIYYYPENNLDKENFIKHLKQRQNF